MQIGSNYQATTGQALYDSDRDARFESFARDVLPSVIQQVGSIGIREGGAVAAASSSGTVAAAGTAAGYVGTGAVILGGLQGALNLISQWGRSTPAQGAASGFAAGAAIGSMIPGVGTAIGAAVGTVVGGLLGFVRSGKHKDQMVRDHVRDFLRTNGVLNDDYNIKLADGSFYDIGKDGGPKAEFGGRRPFEVDFERPFAKYAVSWLNPIFALLARGNQKIQCDFVGYLANAAMSNAKSLADVRDNVNAIVRQFGLTDETLSKAIVQHAQAGAIDSQTTQVYLAGIRERAEVVDGEAVTPRQI